MPDGNLGKIGTIAWREFRHTALTKSFLFGAVILPVLMGGCLLLFPLLLASQSQPLEGTVAVVDPTGRFATTFDALVTERQERDGSAEVEDVMRKLGIARVHFQSAMGCGPGLLVSPEFWGGGAGAGM